MALTVLFNGDSHTSLSPQFEKPTIAGDPYQTPNGSRVKNVTDPTGAAGTCISLRTTEADANTGAAITRSQGLSPSFIDNGEYVTQSFLGYIPASLPSASQFFTMASIYGNPFGGTGTRSMQLGSKPSASTHSFFIKDHNEITFFRATVQVDQWWKLAIRMFFATPGWVEIYFADALTKPFALQTLITGGTRRTYNIREPSVNGTGANHIKWLNYHRYPWPGVSGFTEWFVKYARGYDGAPTLSTAQYAAELNAIPQYGATGTSPTPVIAAPPTPANLRSAGVASQSVSLVVDAVPASTVQTGDTYQWYVNDSSAFFTSTGPTITITTVAPGGAALANGTAYSFRASFGGSTLRPAGQEFSAWTAPLTLTPSVTSATPVVPAGLRVVGVGDRLVSLDWDDNTDNYGQYQVVRDGVTIATGLTVSQYEDRDQALLNDNVYTYQVRAGGTGNQSALSASVQATPRATTAPDLGSLADEFSSLNSALWGTVVAATVSNGRLVLTPTGSISDAYVLSSSGFAVSTDSEIRVTGVQPFQGSASGSRFYLSLPLGTTDSRVVFRVLDTTLSLRHVEAGGATVDNNSVAYNAGTMDTIGVRFTAPDAVQFFTETAGGVRTTHETRSLPFSYGGNVAYVRVGASIATAGTITTPASAESINGQTATVQSANLDPAEEKRLLDDSLTPGTNYTVRLLSTAPSPTTSGTEITGGSYVAQTAQFTSAVSTGVKQFTAPVVFPSPTSQWATIQGFEVWTTGGTPVRKWLKAYSAPERRSLAAGGPSYRLPASTVFRLN